MEIFVSGFSEETTKEQIKRLFGNYGQVIGVKIVRYLKDASKGYAFVKMRDISRGKCVIQKLNGSTLEGKPLVVQKWRRPS